MSRTTSGIARVSENQSRRFMSISSAFGPVSRDGVSGSSAMPQMGQIPALPADFGRHRAGALLTTIAQI